MGLAEYGFALFIFILACIFALLCRHLFARTKTHLLALDEKEKKLLAFYSTMEDIMDEFNESALQANSELAQQISEMRHVAASLRGGAPAAAAPAARTPAAPPISAMYTAPVRQAPTTQIPMAQTPARMNPPQPPAERGNTGYKTPVFEEFGETPPPAEEPKDNSRHARILALQRNGMDRLQIARELSVTLSEVDLVLGIAGQKK